MSKLINQSRLQQFATKLWDKIKGKYDEAFKGAVISPRDGDDKKIILTRVSGATADVDLTDYTRLQDRNEFKKDVSVDNARSVSNLNIGRINGNTSDNRILGYRGTTSKSFVDGYVDHLIIYMSSELTENTQIQTKVWAITKGATTREDRHLKLVHDGVNFPVETFDENGTQRKCIRVPIGEKFTNETYFMVKCPRNELQVCNNINTKYVADVINISREPATTGEIDFGSNNTNNTAIIHLVGRESIKSLSEKLDKVSSDSSTYVKHSDCTDGTGEGTKNGKVLKLDNNGKINKDVLPAIALNEFFTVTTFSESGLANIQYQNGDVIFDSTSQKRYLCINVSANTFNEKFIELNDKTGVVTAINGQNGEVTLSVVEEGDVVKIKANDTVVGTINAITEDEINTIIQNLS